MVETDARLACLARAQPYWRRCRAHVGRCRIQAWGAVTCPVQLGVGFTSAHQAASAGHGCRDGRCPLCAAPLYDLAGIMKEVRDARPGARGLLGVAPQGRGFGGRSRGTGRAFPGRRLRRPAGRVDGGLHALGRLGGRGRRAAGHPVAGPGRRGRWAGAGPVRGGAAAARHRLEPRRQQRGRRVVRLVRDRGPGPDAGPGACAGAGAAPGPQPQRSAGTPDGCRPMPGRARPACRAGRARHRADLPRPGAGAGPLDQPGARRAPASLHQPHQAPGHAGRAGGGPGGRSARGDRCRPRQQLLRRA